MGTFWMLASARSFFHHVARNWRRARGAGRSSQSIWSGECVTWCVHMVMLFTAWRGVHVGRIPRMTPCSSPSFYARLQTCHGAVGCLRVSNDCQVASDGRLIV